MININLIVLGKIKENYFKDAINEYKKMLKSYADLSIFEIMDEPCPENLSEKDMEKVKNVEGEKILSKIKDGAYVIALAIEGKSLDSVAFADKLNKLMIDGYSNITFVIGGSLGLSDEVLERADYKLSFSKMTFPHKLMRVILMEQIYRAFRIINNHPYHKWGDKMIFSFDSYMINVNTYNTEEFMKKLKSVDVDLDEKIISMLEEMSIDYKKPSYMKKLGKDLILKYHAVGEIISYGDVRTNADLKLADGIHPIYFLDDAEIYFTEAVEMREEFLDENSFEININARIK